MKISGPVSYHKLKINDTLLLHFFADAHLEDHKYNNEDYTINDFLLNIYRNTNNIVFYFEGHPEPEKPADRFNDFLTDSNKEFRNELNRKGLSTTNKILFTDMREN